MKSAKETEKLFKNLKYLQEEKDITIIFISHHLDEVMELSDRITVLRKGQVTASGLRPSETTAADLARLMVGRKVLFQIEKKIHDAGEVVLSVDSVCAENDKRLPALREIRFEARAGGMLGLAGLGYRSASR